MDLAANTKAFGKNDIRGIFPTEVNSRIFYAAAKGYVAYVLKELEKKNKKTDVRDLLFTVCMDARLHSDELRKAVIQGITSTGANIIDLGLSPTPIGYYSEYAKFDTDITQGKKVYGALIVTASHNPKEYNGLKMTFNKQSLNESQIKEVKKLTEEILENESGYRQVISGYSKKFDLVPVYQEKLYNTFGTIGKINDKKIKIVVDSANATGGIVAPRLYKDLGCEVIELYSEPDGNFPNHHPNPSDIKTLDSIRKKVVEEHADFGIAFDGDSDRIGIIDEKGVPLTGDKLLLIYAKDIIETLKVHGEKAIVVSEVKCSQVLYDTIEKMGSTAIMTKTGHGYIKEKMKETGATLAGEMSGHTFFKDKYYGYDDAIYAGCRLIEIYAKNKLKNPKYKLSDSTKEFNKVYLSDEYRLSCPNKFKKEVLAELKKSVNEGLFNSKIKEIITIDGLRIVFNDGFALIRQSNTEPVFTLRFEAKTKEKCEQYIDALVKLTNTITQKISGQKV